MLIDIHAHPTPNRLNGQSIISLSIGDKDFAQSLEACCALNIPISIGLHPWHLDEGRTAQTCCDLNPWLSLPQVVAIGETGIDRLRGGKIELQLEIFEHQARLAEELNKPLIVHCVKAFDEIIRLYKKSFKNEPWVIHGFRGKAEQAKQLSVSNKNLRDVMRSLIPNCNNKERYKVTGEYDAENRVIYFDMTTAQISSYHKNSAE